MGHHSHVLGESGKGKRKVAANARGGEGEKMTQLSSAHYRARREEDSFSLVTSVHVGQWGGSKQLKAVGEISGREGVIIG